jgi:hypothetical protein
VRKKRCKGVGKFLGRGCGEESYLFSHGLCKECASRAYREAKSDNLSSGKGSESSKVKKGLKSSRKTTGEAEMFRRIWEVRPHVSEVSGKKLLDYGHKFWYSQFAHVVSKGARPDLRLVESNIILMTFDEHFTWDNHRHLLKGKEEWKWVFDRYESIRSAQ